MIGDANCRTRREPPVGAARLGQFPAGCRQAAHNPDSGSGRRSRRPARRIERECAVLDALPFRIDFAGKGLDAELVHQYLDARLVDIVAAAELIVGAQHRLDIAQHVALVQKRLDGLGEERRAAEPAADHDLEAGFTVGVAVQLQRRDRGCAAPRDRAPPRRPRS